MRTIRLALLVVAVLAGGCAPTERYTTNKTPAPPPAAGAPSPCRMGTPITRLQSRSSNQRSVEGFNSFPCSTTPPPSGAQAR